MKYIKLYEVFFGNWRGFGRSKKKLKELETRSNIIASKIVSVGLNIINDGDEHNLIHYITRSTQGIANINSDKVDKVCNIIRELSNEYDLDMDFEDEKFEIQNDKINAATKEIEQILFQNNS